MKRFIEKKAEFSLAESCGFLKKNGVQKMDVLQYIMTKEKQAQETEKKPLEVIDDFPFKVHLISLERLKTQP